MGNVNQGYVDRIRYILRNINFDDETITEPEGWRSDDMEFERSKIYHGIFPQFSNNLKFVLDGAKYINLVRDLYGVNERIKLIREERNPVTDLWEQTYFGFLDLSTWESEDGKVSCKFNSAGLEQALKVRDNDKFEIDRISTDGGYPLEALSPITVAIDGREIFLKSTFIIKPDENSAELENSTSDGNTRGSTIGIPLFLQNRSHENVQSVLVGASIGDNSWDRTGDGEVSNMFFANSDRKRRLHIKFTLQFTLGVYSFDDITTFQVWIRMAKYQNGVNLNIKENDFLFTKNEFTEIANKNYSITYDKIVDLEIGESLALQYDQNYDGQGGGDSRLRTRIRNMVCNDFTVEEDSFVEKSTTKSVLIFELFERLLAICTNQKKSFRSKLFGRTDIGYDTDGKWSLIGFSHGFWIRGFDKYPIPSEVPKVENLYKPLTTSFKESFEAVQAVLNIGVGIEKEGNKEILRIEELSYFYNRNVTIRLPNQVKKVKRNEASDYNFSSLQFGYEKGGDYEEAMGLDEPNTKSNFTTVINGIKNEYMKIAKFRADSYGFEFARRKPVTLNNTEDSGYDNDIWFQDLKRGDNEVFLQRKWQDNFEKAPTGIFSPDTAFNLRFSPLNMLLRHGWYVGAGFTKYLSDFVRYTSAMANSKMKTKLICKPEYAEDGVIQNAELEKARFVCEEIEFEHVCDYSVMKQVTGTTVIQGNTIRNVYGLVEFINEFNEVEKGFLMNLKPTGSGKFLLLKLNT